MTIRYRPADLTRVLCALVLATAPVAARAGDPPFWVGAAAPCNFNSLAIAIAAVPDGALIRIAGNQSYDDINLSIVNKSLTLEGGWADCTGGTPTGTPVTLQGAEGAAAPVLHVQSSGAVRQVVLRRLHLRGGTRSGVETVGPVHLRIESSLLNNNLANSGGGLNVSGNAAGNGQAVIVDTVIGAPVSLPDSGNLASNNGGGIACQQGSLLLDRVLIRNNDAANGGGVLLNHCSLQSGSVPWQPDGLPRHTLMIVGNRASARGGGLRVLGNSTVFLGEFALAPVIIEDNIAGFDGGGLSLDGNQVLFRGHALWLRDNRAESLGGGGARISGGASLALDWPSWLLTMPDSPSYERGGSHYCFDAHPCNVISGNRIDAGAGVALSINDGLATLARTRISGNGEGGRNQVVLSNGSQLRLSSSLVDGNDSSGTELFRLISGSQLRISTSTVAGNVLGGQVVRLFSDGGGNEVQLHHSIVWQPGANVLLATAADTVVSDCLNANENTSLTAVTDDPGFVDAGNGNFRLRGGSGNVDACPDPFQGVFAFDLIGQPRPVDLDRPGSPGPADRGAYELGDAIFANGFELLIAVP